MTRFFFAFFALLSSCAFHAEKQRTLADIEDAFYGIFANFPSKTLSLAMRGVAFPTGRCYQPPSDTLAQEVSQLMSTDTQVSYTHAHVGWSDWGGEPRSGSLDRVAAIW